MRRLYVGLFCLFGYVLVQAQGTSTDQMALNPVLLEKKMQKSNEDIKDEKNAAKAKTWLKRGELFQDINDVNIEFLRLGMGSKEAKLYLKEPMEVKTVEKDGKSQQEYVYDRINLFFENDALVNWEETKVIHPDPLPVALEAFNKALELDEKGKIKDDVKEDMDKLKKQFDAKAILAFRSKNFEGAVKNFEWELKCTESPIYDNMIDTVIIFNTALAAKNAGDHEKAIKYFRKSADLGYGGSDTYYLLKNEYMALKDSTKALETLEEGYKLYPDTFLLLVEIANYHLTAGNAEEGLKFLKLALEKDPSNPDIYFAMGTLYEKLGDQEKALERYKKTLEFDPEYFSAWYNIGALHFNTAVEMYDQANSLENPKEYQAARKNADEELKKAQEPMEKAHEINPKDPSCLETLKTVYYRLQMEDRYNEIMEEINKLKDVNQ